MKNCLVLSLVLIASVAQAQYRTENLSLDESVTTSAYQYVNLKLYPVRANDSFVKAHKDVGRYTTLQQALKKEGIVITETGTSSNSGTVNELLIQNVSADTILILSGEVVQGGKQDRMIAQDILLYPGKDKTKVSVYCVEHGRWQPNGNGGSFKNYYSLSSNEVRKAGTVTKDQQEVWKKVADATAKNDAQSRTGTLAALKSSESFSSDLKKYIEYFKEQLVHEPDVIGFVAVTGDRILGCDMFATHAMFADHYAELVNSYATEAITSGKPASIKYEEVNRYLMSIISDEQKQDAEINKKGTQLKDKSHKLHISTF